MVKSGLKEAAIGAVGDGIKQLADGEFDPKEMAINAGKKFVSGALNGKFNASCFVAGTMIETADGDRPIEEIQIGNLVLSANPETGEIAYKPVVNTKALDKLGDLGVDSKPVYGRLKTIYGYNKIIGRQSADGKRRWRLDWEETKGPHINVEDFSKEKKSKAIKIAIPFEGNKKAYRSYIKQLNKGNKR